MEFLYQFLLKHYYDLPLHPPTTHMPTGLVVGAFFFLLVALIFKRRNFLTTAHHCIVLALIFLFPAAFLGFTDWQHFYAGVWSFNIKMKIALTGVLLIFLAAAVIVEIKKIGGPMIKFIIYLLCLIAVIGVGHFGGQMVFPQNSAASSGDIGQGEKLYAAHCGGCHPNGGNVINAQLPVVSSPQLKNFNTFIKFNRNPLRPDGSKGVMPAFPKEKISDQDLEQIYKYITKGLGKK
ncbi:MAG TPA: c-type cytochrome [Syntrophales bacterium]|nr:c-type cytochrome [Syntrophales bacterium]